MFVGHKNVHIKRKIDSIEEIRMWIFLRGLMELLWVILDDWEDLMLKFVIITIILVPELRFSLVSCTICLQDLPFIQFRVSI
jgi:hypothetical protein